MKVRLMHEDADFDSSRDLPEGVTDLINDLELRILLEAMAGGDEFVFDVSSRGLLQGLADPEAIRYRQRVLADAIAQPAVARELYDLAGDAIAAEHKVWRFIFQERPSNLVHRSGEVMEQFVTFLRRLRELATEHAADFHSEGFTRFFEMVGAELDESYLSSVEGHLKELKFRQGELFSAELGPTNKGGATSCAGRASVGCASGCPSAASRASASRFPAATRAASGRCPSWRTEASKMPQSRSGKRPTTCSASLWPCVPRLVSTWAA